MSDLEAFDKRMEELGIEEFTWEHFDAEMLLLEELAMHEYGEPLAWVIERQLDGRLPETSLLLDWVDIRCLSAYLPDR